jgi:hypothetical protein
VRRNHGDARGRGQLGVSRPGVRRRAIRWLGLRWRGGQQGRRRGDMPGIGAAELVWTDRVRECGRVRRKKWLSDEKTSDVPETDAPDPSLGGVPRTEGPTTHRHGASRPIDRAPGRLIHSDGRTVKAGDPGRTVRWSRGCANPPGLRPAPASGRGRARSRRGRVHRGEPLLLGVDEEYQITYRQWARGA